MWRRMIAGGLLTLLALATLSCSDDGDAGAAQGEVQRITVEMAELKFEPMRVSVRAGQPVAQLVDHHRAGRAGAQNETPAHRSHLRRSLIPPTVFAGVGRP